MSAAWVYYQRMGIFNRGPKLSPSEKIRAKASKAGVDLSSAWGVGHQFVGGQDMYLGVFPDRVEVHRGKRAGSLTGAGEGVDVYPVGVISSAHLTSSGHWWVLTFTADGVVVNFRGGELDMKDAHQALLKAMQEHQASRR